ncbi:hypothetical protein [Methanobacterium paludis]|uniref:Uncharacterized protein n=1 Tax=Methanobacterium paludis (strain DSM 25820 / JCM 18151 / SWAN1) TaxID=868131 RepID=F6D788_METPW|nr:hypothetical protein [Methanobacterium paludis]AEG18422.1 hypothetical protein MSWAN_1408 [Methanobacterium paludis]
MIAGLLLMGPVSAAKVVDKNTHTVYSTNFHCYGTMSFTTTQYNTKYIQTAITVKYKNGKSGRMTIDLRKISTNKIQIVTTAKAPWGNYKSFNVVKTKWSVSKLYMTSFRYMLRNI